MKTRIIIQNIQKSRRGSKRYNYMFSFQGEDTAKLVIEYVERRWPLGHGNVVFIDGFTDDNGNPYPDSHWTYDKKFDLTMFDILKMIDVVGYYKEKRTK